MSYSSTNISNNSMIFEKKSALKTFIDLFAGIGGIRLGFEKSDFRCIFSNDFDKYSSKTYKSNFIKDNFVLNDINKLDISQIPVSDILCAGFPCQPFSLAGISKRNSLNRPNGFEDKKKGNLIFKIFEVIRLKKPQAIFLENVKNLVKHRKGETYFAIKTHLESLGYRVFYKIINSNLIVPQNRERLYIVAFLDHSIDYEFPNISDQQPKIKDILETNVEEKYTLSDKLWNFLQEHAKKHKAKGNGFGYGLANLDSYSRTLSARYYKDGSEILIPQKGKNPRKLTPRECARLQGFPDSFQIPVSNTQAYKQFGNSVSVPIITYLAQSIYQALSLSNAEQ